MEDSKKRKNENQELPNIKKQKIISFEENVVDFESILFSILKKKSFTKHLFPIDYYNLCTVNNLYWKTISNNLISVLEKTDVISKIYQRIKKFTDIKPEKFMKKLDKSKGIISGSFLLQVILNENWDNSDLDIYFDFADSTAQKIQFMPLLEILEINGYSNSGKKLTKLKAQLNPVMNYNRRYIVEDDYSDSSNSNPYSDSSEEVYRRRRYGHYNAGIYDDSSSDDDDDSTSNSSASCKGSKTGPTAIFNSKIAVVINNRPTSSDSILAPVQFIVCHNPLATIQTHDMDVVQVGFDLSCVDSSRLLNLDEEKFSKILNKKLTFAPKTLAKRITKYNGRGFSCFSHESSSVQFKVDSENVICID